MKFAEHLSAHITPEWRKQYINYQNMKRMLYKAMEEAPSLEITDMFVIESYFGRFAEVFFQYCDKELAKINVFFLEKLAEATRKFANLEADLDSISEGLKNEDEQMTRIGTMLRRRLHTNTSGGNGGGPKKSLREVKLAFSEFYLSLVLLQNYQTLNFQGFRKIAKKHDKLTKSNRGTVWRQANVETATFYTCKDIDNMIKEIENVFTFHLEGGDRQKAMKRLRVPPLGDKQSIGTAFRIGICIGFFIVFVLLALWIVFISNENKPPINVWQPALQMYRCFFLVILFIFLLGINTYGWRSAGVNHVLIFELNPRDHLSYDKFVEVSCFLAVIWIMSILSFLLSHHISIPPFANPICLLFFFILFFLNPLPVFYYKSRKWLLRVLFCIVTAPFHHVGFADFWVADQLNSLSTALLDFEFMICFYVSEINWGDKMKEKEPITPDSPSVCGGASYGIKPLIACLPAWFRFAQCLRRYRDTRLVIPHIVNAGKYATTFFVVLFSTLYRSYNTKHTKENNNVFFYLWIISCIINSCYALTWDLKMDWGLFDKNSGENKLLREEIVYPRKLFYYMAIVENIILRFSWVVIVAVEKTGFFNKEVINSAIASLEVFRRFIWNYFRLENEHLNNCGQFRAVRDISIVPVDSDDQKLLERMMDDDATFVTNRKRGGHPKKDANRILPNRVPTANEIAIQISEEHM